jgi:transcription elongation GreA/GreB family factor
MPLSRAIQNSLERADFAAVEDDWLAHLGQDPADLDYFVGVARALVGTAEEERARFLLELLDEQLREHGLWAVRLKLLQRAGSILHPPEALHPSILETLGRIYGARPTYAGLAEAVGLHRAAHDIPKTWEKVERLAGLLALDVGAVVTMEGRGAGRVVEANLGLESFKVAFERQPPLTVGFKAAPKLLKPLPPGHVLRRKLEEPEALAALTPPELLRVTLESYDRPLTAGEIREVLAGVVAEAQWTSWWSAARKHPQVVAGGAGRQTYRWAETSDHALAAAWTAFAAAEPRRKLELLRREGARDPELRGRMVEELVALGDEVAAQDPGLAFEIWFALERSGGAPAGLAWEPDALLAAGAGGAGGTSNDLTRLLSGIEDRLLRERAYAMARERRADWPAVYRDALAFEADPRALDLLADGLANAGDPAAARELERFTDGLLAQPHRQPAAFTWLAERAARDEALRSRNPLRLLQQILGMVLRDEFAPFRLRLIALAESGATLPRLLAHLAEEQAPQAEEAVHRAAGLEPYQREQLTNALQLRFASVRRETAAPLYATRAAIEAKRAELQQLLSIEIPANRKAIEEARALGDLRENFEYKAARQRHEYLNARAAALNGELARVRPIEPATGATTEVRIGTRVTLRGETGDRVLIILGPWESRPEEDVISYESDLARELLGKKPGDEIALGGPAYRIVAIESYGA